MQFKCSTSIEVNKVEIEFTNKKLTAYGGFSLLAAFFEKIKLREVLEEVIPVKEVSPNSIGIYGKVLAYTLMLYTGGSRFTHLLYLGCHEVLSTLFAVQRLPLASTTLTRLFGKIKKLCDVEKMSDGLWRYLSKLIPWCKILEDWLTFDSSVLERYGKQEGVQRGYNPKKKGRGSHNPLFAFLNKSKYVVNLWNRPGNVASWNNILGFFESTWHRLNGLIKIIGIIADSGFYLLEFIQMLEAKGLKYIIAARLYRPLQMKIYSLTNWEEAAEGIWVSGFWFKHDEWDKERRYITVRQDIKRREQAIGKMLSLFDFDMNEYRYSVWITNLPDNPYDVWEKCRPRANDENTLKELKEDFALGGFSMKKFYSTEAAMLIRVFIYNLFVLFRYEIFEQKEKIERLKTMRYKYFALPAQLGSDGRKAVLRISVLKQKVRSKLLYLYNCINQYSPACNDICNAFG